MVLLCPRSRLCLGVPFPDCGHCIPKSNNDAMRLVSWASADAPPPCPKTRSTRCRVSTFSGTILRLSTLSTRWTPSAPPLRLWGTRSFLSPAWRARWSTRRGMTPLSGTTPEMRPPQRLSWGQEMRLWVWPRKSARRFTLKTDIVVKAVCGDFFGRTSVSPHGATRRISPWHSQASASPEIRVSWMYHTFRNREDLGTSRYHGTVFSPTSRLAPTSRSKPDSWSPFCRCTFLLNAARTRAHKQACPLFGKRCRKPLCSWAGCLAMAPSDNSAAAVMRWRGPQLVACVPTLVCGHGWRHGKSNPQCDRGDARARHVLAGLG